MIPGASEIRLIGHGLAKTGGHDVTGGRLEAAAVTKPVNKALTEAEDSTEEVVGQKIVPDNLIFAMAGRATKGKLFTVSQIRPNAKAPISGKELNQLRARSGRLVHQGLSDGGQWHALAVNDAGIRLDEHLVLDGLGLTGKNISFSVFGIACQAGALRGLELLASRLDLTLTNIVAASQSLASIVPYAEAIILDIGLSGTDIYIIRNDALSATSWIPFGGGFFTHSLTQITKIGWDEAEQLKHAFTNNDLNHNEADKLKTELVGAYMRWYNAVMEALLTLSPDKPLPYKIYLTGGGSLLPGLDRLLLTDPSLFNRTPQINRLGALPGIKDLTNSLDYNLFSLALSLTAGLPD